jgi:hypothetical protein
MTDFYSVLRRSIESRDLKTAEERKQVYDQARKAMIRKLWSSEPRLPEDEIASRIAAFDVAAERIEGDFEPAPGGPAGLAVPEPARRASGAPVVEGYDDEADYAPASGVRAALPPPAREREEPAAPPRSERRALPPPVPAEAAPARPARRATPAAAEPVAPPPAVEDPEEVDDDPLPSLFRRQDPPIERAQPAQEKLWRDDHSDLGFDDGEADPPPRRKRTGEQRAPWLIRLPQGLKLPRGLSLPQGVNLSRGLDLVRGLSLPEGLRRGGRKPSSGKRPARRMGERQTVQLLAGIIVFLGIFLVGFSVYIFYPRSSGSGIAEAGGTVTRTVSDAATAADIPQESLPVEQSFNLFDGRDPQVFFSTPDNPIRFDKDADGGFTRVSSTAGAAGARALIGPGLATRLAGQTIRVTLMARSSKDAGADNLRFAYQSGVAVSHWQVAKVTGDYSEIGLIWRVPAQRTSQRGDVLLIEPGIPGDGSGVDIKSIRIDLIGQG